MKKELLRINRLNYNYTRTRKLENVSFCILEGECIGFLGLSYSGKDLMTSLLRGELTEGDGSGAIYLGGQKVNDWEVLGKEIYYMCPDNYVIEDWTVAEYLCLVDSGWAGSFWRKGVLNEEAGKYFEELELDFDISSRIRDLSELEKRIVDVVKAYRKGARIIIIEDEFDGVSQTDIIKFGKIIRRLIQRKLGVIVNSNSNFIMSELSDKFIIFDRGHVVKKCAREYIKNEEQLERFLLGENVLPSREKIEERTEIFGYLPVYKGSVKLDGADWKLGDTNYSVKNGFIYLPEERKKQGILPVLSIRDNISVSVLDNLKSGISISRKKENELAKSVIETYDVKTPGADKEIQFLSGGNQQKVIIGRAMACKPKLLVFDEPTKGIDVGTKTEIYRLMKKLAEEEGIGIIMISSEMEEIKKCSNRVIAMYEGKIAGEFDEYTEQQSILGAIIGVNS